MDHNLDDSLNLEGDIGVDFEHSEDTVVNQPDIGLDSSSHDEGIPMEFEQIEEQPMLMDTGNEEIIVSDFMADDFQLQEYCTQEMAIASTSAESHDQTVYTSEPESTVSLQYEPQSISVQASGLMLQDILTTPKIINVQAGIGQAGRPTIKKEVIVTKSTAPRQVAIAPKPPKLSQFNPRAQKPSFVPGKQFAIAPKPVGKPVTLVANKSLGFMKKVSLAGAMTTTTKGNSVLAQLGKQLVMVPARAVPPGAQKIKLVSGPGGSRILTAADSKQTQLVSGQTIAVSQASKTLGTKIILQGQPSVSGGNSPAVITKLLPGAPAGSHALKCVTMHQKTVPVSISNNKVVMATPTKQGVRYAGKKQQIIAIRSPTTKLVSATTHNTVQGTANKKIIITSSPSQNVILKTTAPQKAGQVPKIGNVGQRSQLHQINVPGKGIQYIRLITNATQTPAKQSPKASASAPSSKTVILTDSKGKVIQMTSDKMTGGHPPPLVTTNINSVVQSKPQQKLVRIAPVTSRSGQAAMQQARTGQSLLAPVSPSQALSAVTMEHVATLLAQSAVVARETEPDQASETDEAEDSDEDENMDQPRIKEEVDSKDALRALIADTIGDGSDVNEVEVDYDRTQSPEHEDSSGSEAPEEPPSQPHEQTQAHAQTPTQAGERPVIVVPSYYEEDLIVPDDSEQHPREPRKQANMQLEVETLGEYQAPPSPGGISETDVIANELGLLRPRKACNCTKSQCLKLYCDCFANGEFCNRCNCVNCHNNLENEELRQKAIRGCLDRNPNAFRPKIGKSKTGGPEIIRRHNKGCNCKRSGCLKNYCECYEAKIACTAICKCVGCRNVEETLERGRRRHHAKPRDAPRDTRLRPPLIGPPKQPCSFMTCEVIEAVCQCLLAAAVESDDAGADAGPDVGLGEGEGADPVRDVIDEFARCLQDIISASHQPEPVDLFNEGVANWGRQP